MTERSYQDAIQVLRARIGDRWDGLKNDGRDAMVRVLKDELGYSDEDANLAIDAMVRTGQLRYHEFGSEPSPSSDVSTMEPRPVMTSPHVTGAAGLPAAPVTTGAALGAGYWEIGGTAGDELSGRTGQVTPS